MEPDVVEEGQDRQTSLMVTPAGVGEFLAPCVLWVAGRADDGHKHVPGEAKADLFLARTLGPPRGLENTPG
jgi:hypothetical protein